MFNSKPAPATPPAAPQHVSPDRSVPLQDRVELLEAVLRKQGVELPELKPGAKVFTRSNFATRKAEALPKPPRRLASLGVTKEVVETRRRGGDRTPQWREVEFETFMEVGHGARWYRREVGTDYMEPIRPGS